MAERFQRLFTLTPNLYAEGCPIIIEAGALQKDSESGAVIAQIKMRNIGGKAVASCKLSIRAFENNGDEVEGVADFAYLDLNAREGDDFGTKVPIILPNRTTRSFEVDINEIVFMDGSVQKMRNNQWETLPEPRKIEEAINNKALVEQYKIEVGGSADYLPEKRDGFFLCTCGAVNLDSSDACYRCGNTYEHLVQLIDNEYLSNKLDERKKRIEDENIKRQQKNKKLLKIAIAVGAVLLVFVIISSVLQKNSAAKDAEICASVAGHTYEPDRGSQCFEFYSDGTVDDGFSTTTYYGVHKFGKDKYGLTLNFGRDVATTPRSDGNYSYIVTEIQGSQIVEFVSTFHQNGQITYRLKY